ncbi:hypothetical protein FRC17_003344 [Serendipita sp. 399]|nr:hypothetical protein FRC17_003344 [Serendipita sp. 399]
MSNISPKPNGSPHEQRQRSSPNLVGDVLELILDHLYTFGNHKLRPDRRPLARYALISRAWRLPTQILLFREVWIRKRSQLDSLHAALLPKTRHAQLLAHTVRVLWIRIDGLDRTGTLGPDQLPECMRLCPRLYELRLETSGLTRLPENVLRSLEATPPIHALRLIKPTMMDPNRLEYTEIHFQLLQVLRWRLQFFVMEGNYEIHWPRKRYPAPRHQFLEVDIGAVPSWYAPDSEKFLRWLLRNSTKTLLNLSLPTYTSALSLVSPRLCKFECRYSDTGGIYQSIHLPMVEELLWIKMPPYSNPLALIILKQHQVPRLAHLGLDADGYSIALRLLVTPKTVVPKTLKRVTLLQAYHRSTPVDQSMEEAREILRGILPPHVEIVIFRHYEDYEKQKEGYNPDLLEQGRPSPRPQGRTTPSHSSHTPVPISATTAVPGGAGAKYAESDESPRKAAEPHTSTKSSRRKLYIIIAAIVFVIIIAMGVGLGVGLSKKSNNGEHTTAVTNTPIVPGSPMTEGMGTSQSATTKPETVPPESAPAQQTASPAPTEPGSTSDGVPRTTAAPKGY